MGYTATYPRPEETHPTAKNRVWGFFAEPNNTRPANRLQAPQPRREIDPTTTKTASGVFFYGYRYYDPVTGRWPSRDPIGEKGGVNLYGFLRNDGVNRADVLGLEENPSHDNEDLQGVPLVDEIQRLLNIVEELEDEIDWPNLDDIDWGNDHDDDEALHPYIYDNGCDCWRAADLNMQKRFKRDCEGLMHDRPAYNDCIRENAEQNRRDKIDCSNYFGRGWSEGGSVTIEETRKQWIRGPNPHIWGEE